MFYTDKAIDIAEFFEQNKRISKFTFHSTEGIDKVVDIDIYTKLIYTSEKINSEKCCGNILPQYFCSNILHFSESLKYNTCLNKKVCIDSKGNIKNCPSMSRSFGNIKDTKIVDVINSKDFQKLWHVKKDDIKVCRDCEYRYMCHDCRCFTMDKTSSYSKPLKCKYNPYETIWKN